MSISLFANAVRLNHVEEVKQFLREGMIPDIYMLNEVILYGYRELISLFLSYSLEWNLQTLVSSVISRQLDLFIKILQKVSPTDDVLREIISIQSQEFLRELYPFKGTFSSECAIILSIHSNLDLDFLSVCLDLLESIPEEIEIEEQIHQSIPELLHEEWRKRNVRFNIIKEQNNEENKTNVVN